MKAVRKVLVRTLVKEFYRANTGFFLVVLGLGFGFLKTPQHIDLASFLAFTPFYYLVVLGFWMFYTVKTVSFVFTVKRLPNSNWLSYLVLLNPFKRLKLVLYVQTLLLLPILGYGLFMSAIALQLSQWTSVALVISGNLILLFTSAHIVERRLTSPVDTKLQIGFRSYVNNLPKPFPMLFVHHLLNRQSVLLLGTKTASLIILVGFIRIFEMEGADLRLLNLGLLLSAAVNAAFCFHYHQYQQKELALYHNLPISKNLQFVWYGLSYLILMLPELMVFFGNLGLTISTVFLLKSALLPLALLLFYHCLFYLKGIDMDGFMKVVFFVTAILFFVILGRIEEIFLSGMFLLLSYFIFQKRGQRSTD